MEAIEAVKRILDEKNINLINYPCAFESFFKF